MSVEMPPHRVLGRYVMFGAIASGGMASVHFARLLGPAGFSRTVAIKRLHESLAKNSEFTAMMLDEARLAARIRHPNVVPTLDCIVESGELFIVMDYVQGESLARLVKKRGAIPPRIATGIVCGVLHGLHAAHEATSDRGSPLGIVHRDVSPQNVVVGVDGIARVLDFGVAKAMGRAQITRGGQLKGKLSYMPPEQLLGETIDRRVDVWAAAVVLWEALTGRRLFGHDSVETVQQVLDAPVAPPSRYAPDVSPELDAIVLRGLARAPGDRFATALEFALALERAVPPANAHELGEWVKTIAKDELDRRAEELASLESLSGVLGESDVTKTDATVVPRRRRRVRALVALASLALVAGGVATARFWPRAATGPRDVPPAPTMAPSVALAVTVVPSGSPPAPTTTPAATRTAMPMRTVAPISPEPSALPVVASSPTPSCDPPFTLDPSGIKIPKPECASR